MRPTISSLSLLAVLLLSSCEVKIPEYVVAPEKMEEFLYDYHLVQSMNSEYSGSEYKEKLFYDYMFKKHGVSKERFDSSMQWYSRYPKHMKKVYENLEKRLEREVELLGDAKGAAESGVMLDMAYLATDTAELWTASELRLLSATPLNSKMLFSFDIPKDTTFIEGDSLCFSFAARFISGGVKGIEQQAYASVMLEYDNGTFQNNSALLTSSGSCSLALPRNFGARPKYMCGFVYYTDNDSTANGKLLLNAISLKRIHPVPVAEEEKKR